MSDLLSLLSLGSAAIGAQNTGISVATNNVANANTPGYSRQRADLNALPGSPLVGGVRAGRPERYEDLLLGQRVRIAGGALAMSRAFADALADVEFRLTTGGSADSDLAKVFAKIGSASAAPSESTARDSVIAATRELVAGIRRRADALDDARAEVNARIRDNIAEANELMSRLADTNIAIARTGDPAARDERDRLAGQLAELTGGSARLDGNGNMRFVLDGGAVLVDGTHAATLEAGTDPTTGDTTIAVVEGTLRRDVTQAIGAGAIGADRAFRDGALTGAQQALDQLAYDTATQFNNVHTAHAGLDGVSGRVMFTPPTQVAGAAKNLAIDPALDADPSRLALGAVGAGPGDNSGALALTALATQPVATGGRTLTNAALDIVADVANAAATAKADVHRDQLVSEHLTGLRDSLAGVDIGEELTNLSRFEHASKAMTSFISTVDDLLGNLIDRL